MIIIPTHGRLRQDYYEFEASLSYRASSRPSWVIVLYPDSKHKTTIIINY